MLLCRVLYSNNIHKYGSQMGLCLSTSKLLTSTAKQSKFLWKVSPKWSNKWNSCENFYVKMWRWVHVKFTWKIPCEMHVKILHRDFAFVYGQSTWQKINEFWGWICHVNFSYLFFPTKWCLHLSEVDLVNALNPESMIPILANKDVQERLLKFLPEGESLPKTEGELRNTVQSPQFQQVTRKNWKSLWL